MAERRPGRLAILGAGSAGLSALKEALDVGGASLPRARLCAPTTAC